MAAFFSIILCVLELELKLLIQIRPASGKRDIQIGCLLDVMKLFANVLKINHAIENSLLKELVENSKDGLKFMMVTTK